jgi:putative transposase
VVPNLLDQDFAATRPDEKWGSGISYIWTREGWLYLAVVIDVRAPGHRLGNREPAASGSGPRRSPQDPGHVPSDSGLIYHSDRGCQYCSVDYQVELRKHGILISMSGKGNCYDNAMVETFFKPLKLELVWRTIFETRLEATQAIGRYIDGFYNPVRRHSALDFTSPNQFEKIAADRTNASDLSRKSGRVPSEM